MASREQARERKGNDMPAARKHRLQLIAGGALSGPDVCGCDGCVLDEYHDGEHSKRGSKPRGKVVFSCWLHTFVGIGPGCEVCGHPAMSQRLYVFCVDSAGCGWVMCTDCKEIYEGGVSAG